MADGHALAGWTVLDSDHGDPLGLGEGGRGRNIQKGVYGHCPLLVYRDNTGEMLAQQLRPGDAGANDTDDNLAIFAAAVAQLPWQYEH